MVLVISNGASPTPPYSGYYLSNPNFLYGAITLFGLFSHTVHVVRFFNYVVL